MFAHSTTKSNTAASTVGGLIFPVTVPFEVIEDSPYGLYKIRHCFDKSRVDNKHASYLLVYPLRLINFEPVDGSVNRYEQLNCSTKKSPFEVAGLKGFTPLRVFEADTHYFAVRT